jgi:predicted nucleic acid-binding protein
MTSFFADTWFFIALLDRDDSRHSEALEWISTSRDFIVTTRWVLAETANALGGTDVREQVAGLLNQIETDPGFTVVRQSDVLYERGLKLYTERPDKDWSLTDCISFAVMHEHQIVEALTGDRHFEQAGFKALFAV